MKVAIYCRLSDEDRDKTSATDDSASIQNQKSMLITYAINKGWEIYSIYSDDDYSGADRNRPEFNRLLQDAHARKFNIVLCKSQSRFTRELELVEKYIHTLFPMLGIRFVSLVDSADTDDRGNKKSRQINALVNEWFLEELSDNIREVLTSRRQQGYHIGSFAPYGYKKDPNERGHLIIDPEAASVVREIFTLFLDGKGKQLIARTLNERGIPNPTEYKRRHGQVRNKNKSESGLWSYFSISNILTNEVYIGNMVQGKTGVVSYKNQDKIVYPEEQWIVVKGTHEPIIDHTTWDKVQALIEKKATGSAPRTEGIFARKLRCLNCGYRLHSVKSGDKRGFKCNQHSLSHDSCIGAYISLNKLQRIVLAHIKHLSGELLDEDYLEQGIEPFPDLSQMKAEMEEEKTALKQKIGSKPSMMKELYIQKLRGTITESEYVEQMQRLNTDHNEAEARITEITTNILEINRTLNLTSDKKALIAQYTGCTSLTKEMVDTLIDFIEVGKKDPVSKMTPVIIHWNF